jgi:hypothetical protein
MPSGADITARAIITPLTHSCGTATKNPEKHQPFGVSGALARIGWW